MRLVPCVRFNIVSALLTALILLSPISGKTQWVFPTLDPKTYTSPSGNYSLLVNPEDRYAEHRANVEVRLKGRLVWSARMEVTLWNACITDDGRVGGYGFSADKTKTPGKSGFFHVMILDSKGRIRLDQQTPREMGYIDGPLDPMPRGLFVDPENDRMVVRISDSQHDVQSWWIYRLSTATPLTKVEPEKERVGNEPIGRIVNAKPIVGTPLTLLRTWRRDRSAEGRLRSEGPRFTLLDLAGKPVWSMKLPEDDKTSDRDAHVRPKEEALTQASILRADQAGMFDLRFFATSQRVHFAVTRSADGGWKATEMGRTPYAPPIVSHPTPPIPTIPTRQLSYLGSITLPPEYRATSSPVRDLEGFVVAGRDRFAFLRREAKGPDTFVVVNTAGQLIHQVHLNQIHIEPNTQWSGYIWAGGNRFLLTRFTQVLEGKASAWYVDTETGAVSPLVGFDCPDIKRIAAFPDGGFMTLNFIDAKYTGWDEMYAFDAQGKQVWCQKGGQGYSDFDGPERLFNPVDLTVTPEGNVIVLDESRNSVQIYHRDGSFKRLLKLETVWSHKPNYLSDIVPDLAGGFLIFDYEGMPQIIRTNTDGAPRVSMSVPRNTLMENGAFDAIRFDPEGKIWVSNGHALMRLTDAGKVDKFLGDAPKADHLGHIDDLKMTADGSIFALDSRAGAVHVFGPTGKLTAVCRTPQPIAPNPMSPATIQALDSGSVYLCEEQQVLRFSKSGKFLGVTRKGKSSAPPRSGSAANQAAFWTHGLDSIQGIDRSGMPQCVVERLPDRTWMPDVIATTSNPTGFLAAVTSAGFHQNLLLSLYSANGAPLRSFPLPFSMKEPCDLALNGNRIVVGTEGAVIAFDISGKALWKFHPPLSGEAKTAWQVFLVSGGKELRLFDGARTIYRYSMP